MTKTDAQLNKMIGKIQKGPSPTRITNPRGLKKNRILGMKKVIGLLMHVRSKRIGTRQVIST